MPSPSTTSLRRPPRRLLRSRLARALTTPHGVDGFLGLVDPLLATDDVRARVTRVRHQSADTVTLTLTPNANWTGFRSGQFVNVTVEVDGRRHTRCFSPAGPEQSGELELTVKAKPDGIVSRHLHDSARVGTVVTLSQALGDFTLPRPRPRRLLLVCGGSGITPLMSMLRTLEAERYDGDVTFLQYACTSADVLYRDELASLAERGAFDVRTALTHETGAPEADLEGFFCRDHLNAVAPDHADAETYVCGPTPLMGALAAVWAEDGIGERLHAESFVPTRALVAPDADASAGTVTFAASGIAVDGDGATLLELAEGAGLEPASGCRMGICHTCTRDKTSGTVRNIVTGSVSDCECEAVQLCVNQPVGDVVVDL